MKLALVANTTWNIYNFRQNVIRKFLAEGWEIVVIAPVDKYITYRDQYTNVSHIDVKNLDRDSVNPLKDWRLYQELQTIYRKISPNLIIHYTHKPNIYGGLAASRLGIPSIAVITGLGYPFIHNGWVLQVLKQLYRYTLYRHKKVLFENEDDRILFEKMNLLAKGQGSSIKGCGVDTKHFAPIPNTSNGKTVFSFLGRLLYDKGIIEFAEAAKMVKENAPQTRFWVIGEFDEENPSSIDKNVLVDYIQSGVIEYQGFAEDVRPLIAKSDCVVLPSYREAIARTLTEAMSMGKPVIATDTAGCREAVEHQHNGLLVPVNDVNALSKAFIDFIHMTEVDRRKLGDNSRKKAQQEFDDVKIAEQIFHLVVE